MTAIARQQEAMCPGCLQRFTALESRVERLEARRRPADYDEAGFLLAIANATRGHVFTAAELRAHGAVDAELRGVLVGLTPRQIGRRLRGLSGRTIGGLSVRRVTRDEHGVVWIVDVSGDHQHTDPFQTADRSA